MFCVETVLMKPTVPVTQRTSFSVRCHRDRGRICGTVRLRTNHVGAHVDTLKMTQSRRLYVRCYSGVGNT